MIFKKTSILFAAALTAFVFMSSCEDGKKKEEQLRLETERVDNENAETAKLEMEAKAAEKKRIEDEGLANSIGSLAMANKDLSTLSTALQAAGLSDMLSQPGEYTVFAPSNEAFAKLPKKTLDDLLKPENKEKLADLLSYHVASGALTADQLAADIKEAKGTYTIKAVKGGDLSAMMTGDKLVIKDASGKKANVVTPNVSASNGVIYIIDTVLMPKK